MDDRPAGLTRRRFIQTMAASAALFVTGGITAPVHAQRRRPNVLFVFSDEHRWQSMSFSEMPELYTPNMKRLADQGVTFTRCISNYPVCSPYRGIFLTGRWPYQTGVVDNDVPLSASEMTLGKAFKSAGYHTGYIGKWHLGGVRAEPFGFDHSLIWTETNNHWDTSRYHPANGEPVQPKGYNATRMTDQALEFIEAHKSEPFFLALSLNPPHANFLDPPEDKKALYPEGKLSFRPNVPMGGNAEGDGIVQFTGQGRTNWPTYQGYHGHVSAIDEELGRLLDKLEELKLAEDTILVYTSDHGSMQGSHGLGGKRQPYDESIRVPFMIRYPGVIAAGRIEDALLGTIDLAPTLMGLAGLDTPDTFQGRDFSPLMRGEPFDKPRSQLIMHIAKENASGGVNHPAPLFRGLRTDTHTYAVFNEGGGLLFDNVADPYQLTNLFDTERANALRDSLAEELKEALRRANDPLANVLV